MRKSLKKFVQQVHVLNSLMMVTLQVQSILHLMKQVLIFYLVLAVHQKVLSQLLD